MQSLWENVEYNAMKNLDTKLFFFMSIILYHKAQINL